MGCSLDEKGFGCLFLALDPEAYCERADFESRVDALIRHVKSSRKRPTVKEIFLPGEIELREREQRRQHGIYLDNSFWEDIVSTARQLKVNIDEYISVISE